MTYPYDVQFLLNIVHFLEKYMVTHKVAFLTAGGIAPCLSSVIGMLISRYNEILVLKMKILFMLKVGLILLMILRQ
ncbi:hypothetical protein AYJ09_04070 [Candidatus Liberibacter solanacearum]|nr:hypothetical protein AYJ09_04070 [Candidatus Liberibacter solanacearum]